jgi:Transposase DDE domain
LWICKEAGLVKLGFVALDGTKIKANASKHRAMSYARMVKKEREFAREVEKLLQEAEALDEREDKKYGKDKRGDELPPELRFKEKRLEKIREAKRALEEEACGKATDTETRDKDNKPPTDGDSGPPTACDAPPEPKKQRNFTDPDSRIMRDSATKAFEQAYNAQAGVDCDSQVIVTADVTQQANDKQQLVPMLEQIEENLGEIPDRVLADPGYFTKRMWNMSSVASWSLISLVIEASTPMHRNRLLGDVSPRRCLLWIGCCASSRQKRERRLIPREKRA